MKRTAKRGLVPTGRHPLSGTWVQESTEPDFPITSIEFTISLRKGEFAVRACDKSDGEELKVSGVRWNGEDLKFTTLCLSTKWRAKHVFRMRARGLADHRVTYTELETWKKESKPSTSGTEIRPTHPRSGL
jgi:hypothetical protein